MYKLVVVFENEAVVMRFLYFTDSHCRGTSPTNRKDNYVSSLMLKLKEVAFLAQEWEVTAILHGGDLWDLPNPSLSVADSYLSQLEAAGVPIYVIAGNHDLHRQDLSSIPYTMLGLQAAQGRLRIINSRDRLYFQNSNVRVQITGQPYHLEIDRRDPGLDYCVTKQDCDYAIHLVHGNLMAGCDFPGSIHTHFSQVYKTEADLTLVGHMHFGFPDYFYEGKWFINIGALARLTNHLEEFKRTLQVLLIDLSLGHTELRKLPLKSVLPANRVLDRNKAEYTARQVQCLIESVLEARNEEEFINSELKEVVDFIGIQEGMSREIRQEALRSVHAKLGTGQRDS
ncbi:MAG: metallophosphoesterase [Bacillota bacterium]